MRVLVSEKLSEHKYKTPEGYLICTDAILARTGKQAYTRDELFGDGDNTEVNVDRPYNEVMNEKTIASFENKPITFDHPEEDVNIGNYKSYAVGYVRDVRQGKVDGKDVILGNLVITDKDAIDAIENGDHTDLSCGYDCDIKDDGNGNYAQNNIRGNHVALCREGRAGMARIVDSKVSYKDLDAAIKSLYRYGYKFDVDSVGRGRLKITPTEGQDFDKLVTAFRANAYRLIMGEGEQCFYIKDSKIKDGNYIYEFYYNDIDNEDRRMMRKYNLEIVGKSGKDRGERNLAVKGSLENLKRYAKDYLGYELHPNYLIPESQFAYDMYDSAKDDKMEDAADYSWFKGYINGDLQSFNINSLINSVKSRKQPLHANLTGKSGSVYSVFIDGSLESDVDKGSNMWIDIVVEYPDRQQKRLISKDFNSWNECQNIFNTFKNKVRDSAKDSKMKDEFSGIRNGITYWYDNNEYFIRHRNGKVERIDGDTFEKVDDLYKYIDGIKDSKVRDSYFILREDMYGDYLTSKSPIKWGKKKDAYRFNSLDELNNFKWEIEKVDKDFRAIRSTTFEVKDSKMRDWTPEEVRQFKVEKRGEGYGVYYKGQLVSKYSDYDKYEAEEELKRLKRYYYVDSKMDDSGYTYKGYDLIDFGNVVAVQKDGKTLVKCPTEKEAEEWVDEHVSSFADSRKKMTMSNAIKMLNIIDAYKKVRDADKWVIKNTGLAYEIWNQGKMVKKLPTKKLAIEWIRSRFPGDEITEDSKKVAPHDAYKKVRDINVNPKEWFLFNSDLHSRDYPRIHQLIRRDNDAIYYQTYEINDYRGAGPKLMKEGSITSSSPERLASVITVFGSANEAIEWLKRRQK